MLGKSMNIELNLKELDSISQIEPDRYDLIIQSWEL
jgi:hypothetical protein